jgi:hypothetical protein
VINEAQAEREAARAELANVPSVQTVTDAAIYAMIDSLGDLDQTLREKRPDRLAELYEKLGLDLRFHPIEKAVYATAYPRVVSECVRGGDEPPRVAHLLSAGVHVVYGTAESVSCQCVLARPAPMVVTTANPAMPMRGWESERLGLRRAHHRAAAEHWVDAATGDIAWIAEQGVFLDRQDQRRGQPNWAGRDEDQRHHPDRERLGGAGHFACSASMADLRPS